MNVEDRRVELVEVELYDDSCSEEADRDLHEPCLHSATPALRPSLVLVLGVDEIRRRRGTAREEPSGPCDAWTDIAAGPRIIAATRGKESKRMSAGVREVFGIIVGVIHC